MCRHPSALKQKTDKTNTCMCGYYCLRCSWYHIYHKFSFENCQSNSMNVKYFCKKNHLEIVSWQKGVITVVYSNTCRGHEMTRKYIPTSITVSCSMSDIRPSMAGSSGSYMKYWLIPRWYFSQLADPPL